MNDVPTLRQPSGDAVESAPTNAASRPGLARWQGCIARERAAGVALLSLAVVCAHVWLLGSLGRPAASHPPARSVLVVAWSQEPGGSAMELPSAAAPLPQRRESAGASERRAERRLDPRGGAKVADARRPGATSRAARARQGDVLRREAAEGHPSASEELARDPVAAVVGSLATTAAKEAVAEPSATAAKEAGAEPPAPEASASASEIEPATVPTYRTAAPPSERLSYTLRRGALSGSAQLHWEATGERYEARLEANIQGRPPASWTSRGGFDAAGIAPERYVEQPGGRGRRAANFQRSAGRITFSGPAIEYPLQAGMQDRLSWMIQLAAIANARPLAGGDRLVFSVAGAGGSVDAWTFDVLGLATVETDAGALVAWHLARNPARPYDTRAEIWLDPARHHLPVRVRLTHRDDGSDAFELLRSEAALSK